MKLKEYVYKYFVAFDSLVSYVFISIKDQLFQFIIR